MARFGAFLRNAFGGSRTDPEAVARVKGWVHGILKAGSGTVLAVNEIVCTDPSCPGVETVVPPPELSEANSLASTGWPRVRPRETTRRSLPVFR